MVEASGFSLAQERALAICPKISAAISIPCSISIIWEVIYLMRTRGTTPVQRSLMAMSCVDVLASSGWFLSTWAVPKGSFAYAAGNTASCDFQGFLLQLAIGAPLYNSSLAIFYLLMIKRRWTDDKLKQIERSVHGIILSFSIGSSILLLLLEQYNHVGAVCWVIGDPRNCGDSTYQGGDVPCERGSHAWAWGLALFYGPLWFCVIACCTSMLVLWHEVRKTHSRSRRYSDAIHGMKHSANRSGNDEQKVAIQAILFSLTFLITWMPSTLWSIGKWFNWTHFGLDIAAAIAEPLQGFWNFLIFLKSRPETVARIRSFWGGICLCCLKSRIFGNNRTNPPSEFSHSFATGLKNRFKPSDDLSDMSVCDPCTLDKEIAELQGASVHGLFGNEKTTENDDNALPCKMLDMSDSSMGDASVASCLPSYTAGNDHGAQMAAAKECAPAILLPDDSETSHGSQQMSLPQSHAWKGGSCSASEGDEDRRRSNNGNKHGIVHEEEDQTRRGCAGGESIASDYDGGDIDNDRDNYQFEDLVKNHVPDHFDDMNSMLKRFHGLEECSVEVKAVEVKGMNEHSTADKHSTTDDIEPATYTEQGGARKLGVMPSDLLAGCRVKLYAGEMDRGEGESFYFM